MRLMTTLCGVAAVHALSASVISPHAATAATITPVAQNRDVSSFVIVPPCPPTSVSDNDQATDFEPFRGAVLSQRTCDFGHGLASADQQSSIGAARLEGLGSAHCEAAAAPTTVIHAIPNTGYEVSFHIAVPTRAILLGELNASGTNPVVASYARLRMFVSGSPPGTSLFDQTINPGPLGATNTLQVQAELSLAPGSYAVRADAAAIIDATIPPAGEGTASFDVEVLFQRAGDANVDGDVNIHDLLDVINAWGSCASPTPCLSDMDSNGLVNINDLLTVINNWE
jgi:hypothetical protein